MQVVDAAEMEYVPAAQDTQKLLLLAAVVTEYVPDLQVSQLEFLPKKVEK